jgi:hypothetical protein
MERAGVCIRNGATPRNRRRLAIRSVEHHP